MIRKTSLNENWIRGKSKEISADPILIERAIYAFELLSQLIKGKIPLIFRGGTSLMLLLPKLMRLDVDIVTDVNDRILMNTFANITKGAIFKRWEEDIKGIRKNRNDLDKIKKISLIDNYSILNKLKKISPESFYLWAAALNII